MTRFYIRIELIIEKIFRFKDLLKNFSQTIEFKINFESTMNTLKYEILDIILNYRINTDLILPKFKTKCSMEIGSNINLNTSNKLDRIKHRQKRSKISNESLKIKLHLFFIDLNSYFYNLTNFWNQIIPNACKTSSSGDECWNGYQITR